jgi:hypothetical protein
VHLLVVKAAVFRLRLFPSMVPVCVVPFQIVNQHNDIHIILCLIHTKEGHSDAQRPEQSIVDTRTCETEAMM